MNSIQTLSKTLKPIALATSLMLATSGSIAVAGHHGDEAHSEEPQSTTHTSTIEKWKGDAYQGWLDGKVETALLLNTNLNNFTINTKTENNVVTLFGEVNTEVQAELAEQITKGVKGVDGVINELTVNAEAKQRDAGEGKSFSQHWSDATTTATVKSKLLLEDTIKGLDINVDTNYSVVTLNGTVRSDAERDLVCQIAKNTANVESIEDKLTIDKS